VIEAIQSRTIPFKFQSITVDDIKEILHNIAEINKIEFTDEIYDSIAIMSNGDLKQAINCLQVFSRCKEKTLKNFYHLFNIPSLTTVQQLIEDCIKKNSSDAFKVMTRLIDNGYNISDILDIIIKVVSYSRKLTDRQRVTFIEETTKIICTNEICPSITHLYKLLVQFIVRS